jgi:hypothetical protein
MLGKQPNLSENIEKVKARIKIANQSAKVDKAISIP